MKISAIFLFTFLCLFSCRKNDIVINNATCDVGNPVQELPWLRELIREAKDKHEDNFTTVKLLEVNGRPVFNYYVNYWSCYGCVNYFCDGTKLDMSKFSEAEKKEFYENLSDTSGKSKIIWPE